jgi:hypothetical protein
MASTSSPTSASIAELRRSWRRFGGSGSSSADRSLEKSSIGLGHPDARPNLQGMTTQQEVSPIPAMPNPATRVRSKARVPHSQDLRIRTKIRCGLIWYDDE